MTGRRSRRASLGDVEIEIAVPINRLWSFQALALHLPILRNGPWRKDSPGWSDHRQAVACQLDERTACNIKKSPSLRRRDVPRVDAVNTQRNRLAPRSEWMRS